ncbi:M23 family metallopeptidase [Hyphomonas sp.]|uniref:M23 family metallopeptidase n=1 Tax=Hyphomonas sp. TaxID=87 RepID=UPI0025BEDF85|nr:M23 family metallopeptidase [Hyphomonas sp.]
MRHALAAAAAALLFTSLAACDFVRFPGDGGPPPETPDAGPAIPPGAPGPPPPEVDDSELDTPVETPPDDTPLDTGPETPTGETPPVPVDATDDPETPPVEVPVDVPPADTPADDPAPPAEPEVPVEVPPPAVEPVFSYHSPGTLLAGTGSGFTDQFVHAPDMVFPIKSAPTVLQSQVFSFGGGVAGGDQCDARNFAAAWRDNFCETRSANRTTPFCPVAKIHQGQDIRVGTPDDCKALRKQTPAERGLHEVVAVEDGIISSIGTYTVKLRADGRIYNYMHMNMNRLAVTAGQSVKAGDLLGFVSNDFGGTATTLHLHFEILQNSAEHGWVHVPPYLSLVAAYERRENAPGEMLEPQIGVASAEEVFVIPEGMEIIE